MIIRWYEISCDGCGCGEQFQGNKTDAERQAKEGGWIFFKGKHYDSRECFESEQIKTLKCPFDKTYGDCDKGCAERKNCKPCKAGLMSVGIRP